ncbi:MAG TPA: glucodextranase DOMON-like domain-containing protein [Cystobacter sp.]
MKTSSRLAWFTLTAALLGAPALAANKVSFKDPTGDDNGPGTYKYPTDPVYKPGSFDLTDFSLSKKGDKLDVTLGLNSTLEDAWKTGSGFAVQLAFVFIDTDGKAGSGSTESLPGLNVKFAPEFGWEKVIVLSPAGAERVKSEVASKAGAAKDNVLVPERVKGSGKKISATVNAPGLQGDPSQWRYQVLIQSNEGFPADKDLLTRKVNEYEGQHRFGGGNDGECDPHVMDMLAGAGKGDASEVKAQHEALAFECGAEGAVKTQATIPMVGGAAAPTEKK